MMKNTKIFSWGIWLIYAILLAAMYWPTYAWLIGADWPREDYDYCYMIPFVVAYLLWERRKRILSLPAANSPSGLIFVCLGIALFWIGELAGEIYSSYVSSWFLIVGLLWLHFGKARVLAARFPVFMILTMFPPPHFINNKIMLSLKLVSSQIGVYLLQLYSMSAYREGNIIDLGFTQLQVVDACSGLRYVVPLTILGLLLANLYRAAWWKKIVLFLSSIPLAIISNSIRIASTGVLYEMFGAEVAEDFFHGFSGWLIFVFTLLIMITEMWLLKYLPPRVSYEADKEPVSGTEKGPAAESDRQTGLPLFTLASVACAALLALTVLTNNLIDFRQKTSLKQSLEKFPVQVGQWSGSRETMGQEFIDVLRFDEYTMVMYQNPSNHKVHFYVAYYKGQQKGGVIHSPETCLPGSGWLFRDSGRVEFLLSNGQVMRVNRAFMEKGAARQVVYFWFPQRGRILTNIYQLKIYSFWDALTKRRTDGALVRVVTPVYGHERLEDADRRNQAFIREIYPTLSQYLPGETAK